MLYIDILKYSENKTNKIMYFIKRIFNILSFKKVEDKKIVFIPIEEKDKKIKNLKVFMKLNKYLKDNNYKSVVLSEKLENNEILKKLLKDSKINILDGTWLFNYILEDVINYIVKVQKTKIEREEISVLVNEINDVNIENIKIIAKECKVLNIITNQPQKFESVERYLNDNFGIIINITKNMNKSLSKSNIIVNIDYSEELLNSCNIPKYCIVININKKEKIVSKSFEGINILNYKLIIPSKYIKIINYFNNFNNDIIYESFIYTKNTYNNIKKLISDDKLRVKYLIGNNGKIGSYEYTKIKKFQNTYYKKYSKMLDKSEENTYY